MDELRRVEVTDESEWPEWLSTSLRPGTDDVAIEHLLANAVEEMSAAFGTLAVPARRISITYASRRHAHEDSVEAYQQAHPYVMTYMQRHAAPMVANHPPSDPSGMLPVCKIMAIPVTVRRDGPVGVLAFCKPVFAANFNHRELDLARRIARLLESLLSRGQGSIVQFPARSALRREATHSGGNKGNGHGDDDDLARERLRAALDEDRLQVFAQRIAPLRDMARTSDIECLVRLISDDGAVLPPARLLPIAARHQLMSSVDAWMIDNTLATLEPHAASLFERGIHVALNISEQALCDERFLDFVEDRVRTSDIRPSLLTFEIAETVAARNLMQTGEAMSRLRKLGCSVALDDFGARLVSLGHLQALRPDRVKIDSNIVRSVLESFESEAIVRTIVKLADALFVECVAKHVETDALVSKLRELGVGYAQGHRLHMAEPLTQLMETHLLA